jgi:hypothetical protein
MASVSQIGADDFSDLLPAAQDPYPNLHADLKKENRFLVFRYAPKPGATDGRKNKVPFDARTGKPANQAALGMSYEEAVAVSKDYDGIGYYLGGGWCGVDYDACVSDGTVSEKVAAVIRAHPELYWEASVSGLGIHGIGRGSKPGDACRKGNAEIYDSGRWFTCSGFAVGEPPDTLRNADFTDIYVPIARGDFVEPSTEGKSVTPDSAAAPKESVQIQHVGTALTSKYELFMRGTVSGDKPTTISDGLGNTLEYPDRSAVDLAFCNEAAIKHDGDADAIWNDYLVSAIYRDKWGKREEDFRRLTIAKAIKKSIEITQNRSETPAPTAEETNSSGSIVTQRASQIQKKNIKWLWDNRVPFGKLTIFGGNPDEGKSLVTMYMVARLTRGAPLEGSDITLPPCDVLVMAGEDDAADTIVPRLESMGADLNRVHLVSSVTVSGVGATREEREVQLDTDIKEIEKILQKLPEVRLIVIDPVSNYLGRVNMNREQEVRSILVPLKSLAARTGISILGVMHLNKNNQTSAIHRIGGAMAFSGVARAAWMFMSDTVDKDVHMMLRIKKNIGLKVGGLKYKINSKALVIDGEETQQPYITWLGPTDDVADDVLTAGIMGRPPEKGLSGKDWLIQFLAEGGGTQSSEDVIRFGRKAGHAERTLRRIKDEIGVVAYQDKRRWFWRFKTTDPIKHLEAIEVDF